MSSLENNNTIKRSIIWFRKGLRIHDNPALIEAITKSQEVLPMFMLDPWFCNDRTVSRTRMNFLLEALTDLNENLKSVRRNSNTDDDNNNNDNNNDSSCLLVIQGKPIDILPKVIKRFNITNIYFEKEQVEPFGKQRDEEVKLLCKELNVECRTYATHTLYDQELLLCNNQVQKGIPPSSMTQFQKILAKVGEPSRPVPSPAPNSLRLVTNASEILSNEFEYKTGIPSLKDLGYAESNHSYKGGKGGETEGLKRLRAALNRGGEGRAYVRDFDKPSTSPCELFTAKKINTKDTSSASKLSNPFEIAKKAAASQQANSNKGGGNEENLLMWPSTTALSPHLKFGTVSIRQFYHELNDILKNELDGKHTNPPTSLMGQILWREFYYINAYGTPNYDKMVDNRICKQIPWKSNPSNLAKWENAQTGYPWIDAAMTQLKQEGWMHHLARHAVACFLTRGDLFISWEEGAKVFDRDLVDADWALNNGNWMWLSASSFFYQYFRVYGPHSFAKKYDKNGDYVRHYLPVLKNMPAKYIYEPWTAPIDVQKKAGCVVGIDYPEPIVDHAIASKQCMGWMAEAYKAGKEDVDDENDKNKKKKPRTV